MEELLAGQFKDSEGLLAGDGGELFEEVVERAAVGERIEEVFDRHPRACEAGRAAEDFGVRSNGGHRMDYITRSAVARVKSA